MAWSPWITGLKGLVPPAYAVEYVGFGRPGRGRQYCLCLSAWGGHMDMADVLRSNEGLRVELANLRSGLSSSETLWRLSRK